MTATELLNQLDILRLQLVNAIETKPGAPVRAYIADNDGNTFDVSVERIALEADPSLEDVTIAILSDDVGDFTNG